MSIWFQTIDLTMLNALSKNNMLEHLGIEFTEIADNYLVARMAVDHRTQQPLGILHGGASCVLAESVASIAANFCVDITQFYCVGIDINTNHIRPVSNGFVTATATPFHLGKITQVWAIEIVNDQHKLISVTRLTVMVKRK